MPKARNRTASAVRGPRGKDTGTPALEQPISSLKNTCLICLALAGITLLAFWGIWGNQFVNFDDNKYIFENPNVQTGLTGTGMIRAFNVGYCSNWHPLTWMSHMLDYSMFGQNAGGHHAVGLIFHIMNSILLLLVLKRLTKSVWKSVFVAALFAVHPLHVESVAWAAERKDVLSTFFWMLTMGAYALYAERPSVKRYLPVALFFALGLMAKPMLVTLPFVLLLLDFWPLRRMGTDRKDGGSAVIGRLITEKLPLHALAVGSSVLTFIAQRRGDAVSSLELVPLNLRVENALVSYAGYLIKMLYPRNLAVMYPFPMHEIPVWQMAGAALVLIGVSVLAVRTRRSHPYLLFGWLWYVGTLVPVIGLVQVGSQAMADRYTYIPLIGLFIAIAWGISAIAGEKTTGGRHPRAVPLSIAAGVTVVVLMVLTHVQVGYWHDNLSLFRHAVECTQNNYMMHNSLGLALDEAGKPEEALAEFRKSVEIAPTYVSGRLDLGIALSEQGRLDEAIPHFDEAIRDNPNWADSHFNLGRALEAKGNVQGAIEEYTKAIELKPNHEEAHINLGNILSINGNPDEAIKHYDAALQVNPLSVTAHTNMATALARKHDMNGAIREYREAIRIKPDCGVAHSNLAILLYYQQDYAESWKEVHQAQNYGETINPKFVMTLSAKMPEPTL